MKKIFSAFLLMTMMVASVGSFVSCSDIEDAIAKVENTANDNAAQIKDLEGKIAALQTALATAQADAAAAKAAADKAAQAAATAKAEAIEAALAEIAKVQGDVDAVEAAIAAVEAKLALKADVATVEQIQKTLEIYAGLGIEDKAEAEAVAALLAKIEAGEFATAESVADLVAQVKAINTKLAAVTNIVAALANQIQSVVYVPETLAGTAEASGYVLPAADPTKSKYTDLLVKMTYEVSPKALATAVTAENTVFATVPVKAAAAEYFAVEVVEASEETGRVVVYAHIPVNAKSAAYNALTDDKTETNVALALTVADPKEIAVVMGEEEKTLDAGSYVQSAYVGVTSKAEVWDNIYDNFVIYNTAKKEVVTGKVENKVEVPYNTAPATTNLFADYDVRVKMEGEYMTVAEAAAFTGFTFELKNEFKVKYYNPANKEVAEDDAKNNPFTVTGKDFAATAQFANVENVKDGALVGYYLIAQSYKYTVNKQRIDGHVNSTYVVTEKKSDFGFSPITIAWKHTYGASVAVPAQELAVNGTDFDITKTDINKTNFVAEWKSADGKTTYKANAKVEAMSSKAVKLVSTDALPFVKGADATYTFKGNVIYNKVNYTVAFDVTLGAMPEDKTIDLGTFNIDAATESVMTIKDITPVTQTQAWIKATDATVPAIDKVQAALVAGKKVVKVDGEDAANSLVTINPSTKVEKKVVSENSTIVVSALSKYENTITVSQVYSIYGVNFTYTATIVTKKPEVSFKPASAYVKADGTVDLDGTVKFEKNDSVTFKSEAYVLNAINLRNYVDVTIPEALKDEFVIRYTLKNNPFIKEYDKDGKPVYNLIPGSKTETFDETYFPSVTSTKLAPTAACPLNWNAKNDMRTLTYEIALVSKTQTPATQTEPAKDVVFASFDVTLVIPEVIKSFTAADPIKVKYENGNAVSANIVKAIKVTDKLGNAVYNPYATTVANIWSGYDKRTKATTPAADTRADFFQVYGQQLVLPTENAGVKATINGTDVTSQVKPSVDATGKVTINPETATLTGDVVVEVPVALTYIYDEYGVEAKTATVQVVFEVK